MRRELDNRTKRAIVFSVIHTINTFVADPSKLNDELQPLVATMLGDLIMTLEGGERGAPYVFDLGEEWIEMYKGTEDSLRKHFPECFSNLIMA